MQVTGTTSKVDMDYPNKCPICLNKEFEFVHDLNTSYWDSHDHKLKRKEIKFKLVECKSCKHIICAGDYSAATFSKLYPLTYKSSAIKSKPVIYLDIIEFNSIYLKEIPDLYLADFGGSDGSLLIKIGKSKIGHRIRESVVFDRFVYKNNDKIMFKKVDLDFAKNNNLDLSNFNYGFCVHTLEHLLYPREFLEFIFDGTQNGFTMYIEVPANELVSINASVDLIRAVHIQYFTLNSLVTLAISTGFKIIKAEIKETSGVPRIKSIIKKEDGAKSKIISYFNDFNDKCKYVSRIILENARGGKVALWGVGNELYEILKKDEMLKKKIQIGDVLLIDTILAGKVLYGIKIHSPYELTEKINRIIITPRALYTRKHIVQNAVQIGFPHEIIIDPYENYN